LTTTSTDPLRAPGFPAGISELDTTLRQHSYIPDPGLSVALYLGLTMSRPILLEGAPGVGKTEVARTLSRMLGGPLIRLQCYEGIDASQALYEWDYARQMLQVRAWQQDNGDASNGVAELYGPEFLLERPLLRAVRETGPRVLLIDELDRADDEFDAFLLEVLDDFGVTVPEIGRFTTDEPPIVIITSNRTRELHDAIKRRCMYHWIDFPDVEREAQIIRLRAPGVDDELARSVATAIAALRDMDLTKTPGATEAIDWARAMALLGASRAEGEAALATLGWVAKSREDMWKIRPMFDLPTG
jgi:MoxR-like ATPase